jgi:hypothetical protein
MGLLRVIQRGSMFSSSTTGRLGARSSIRFHSSDVQRWRIAPATAITRRTVEAFYGRVVL